MIEYKIRNARIRYERKKKKLQSRLQGERTVNEIASRYEVLLVSLKSWKKHFLENMSLAFDKSIIVKEYKDKIEVLQKDKDMIVKKFGETIVEKEFLEGNAWVQTYV
jgi:putative transposase